MDQSKPETPPPASGGEPNPRYDLGGTDPGWATLLFLGREFRVAPREEIENFNAFLDDQPGLRERVEKQGTRQAYFDLVIRDWMCQRYKFQPNQLSPDAAQMFHRALEDADDKVAGFFYQRLVSIGLMDPAAAAIQKPSDGPPSGDTLPVSTSSEPPSPAEPSPTPTLTPAVPDSNV